MNSLRMYVLDATGEKHCFTCATNREGLADAFRRHAKWWTRTGYKSGPVGSWPCFPVKIIIEEYQDSTC